MKRRDFLAGVAALAASGNLAHADGIGGSVTPQLGGGIGPGFDGGASGGGAGLSYFSPVGAFESEGGSGPIANSGDPAFYDAANGKVWYTWEAGDARLNLRYVCVRTYHIATDTWSPIYVADTRTLTADVHGTPSIAVVAGYAFIAFGHHSSAFKIVVSANSNDPSTWTQLSDISGSFTFTALHADATKLYLFTCTASGSAPGGSGIQAVIQMTIGTPTGATVAWCTAKALFDGYDGLGVGGNYNTGGFLPVCGVQESLDGTEIYFIGNFSATIDLDPNCTDFYIGRYVKATGAVKNWSGSSGSLPINKTAMDANFKILSGTRLGHTTLCVDAAGDAHIAYGVPASGNFNVTLNHRSATPGGAWSSARALFNFPSAVAALGSFGNVTRNGTDGIRVWTADGSAAATYGGGCSGNVIAFDRSAAGVWSAKKGIIRPEGSTYALDSPSVIRNGPAGARVFTTENAPNYLTLIGNLRGYTMSDTAVLIPPTSIYDRWSPVEKAYTTIRADGLRATVSALTNESKARSLHGNTTGKRFWQVVTRRAGTPGIDNLSIGLSASTFTMLEEPAAGGFHEYLGRFDNSFGLWLAGYTLFQDGNIGNHATLADNAAVTTYSFCLDIPNLKLWIKNDTRATAYNPDQVGADPATGVGGYSLAGWTGGNFYITCNFEATGDACDILAGPGKAGTPPTGFSHWITTY